MSELIAFRARSGRRRRRPDGARPGDRRRHRPAPGAGQVPGRVRRRLRGRERHRPADRRVLRRQPLVALGVLRQPADRRGSACRGGGGAPGTCDRATHKIDYLRHVLLAGVATSLVLATSLGGTTYAWCSAPIIGCSSPPSCSSWAGGSSAQRAAEPVLPLRLFRNRVFRSASAIGFVGRLRDVRRDLLPAAVPAGGEGRLADHVRRYLLPLVVGLLLTSIGSGQIIARRPVQGLPDRRHRGAHVRAPPAVLYTLRSPSLTTSSRKSGSYILWRNVTLLIAVSGKSSRKRRSRGKVTSSKPRQPEICYNHIARFTMVRLPIIPDGRDL